MHLEYNNVPLRIVDFAKYSRVAVYTPDESDLLHVEHTIGVLATYSPGGIPAFPTTTGMTPDQVDRHVRDRDDTAARLIKDPAGDDPGTPTLGPGSTNGLSATGAQTDMALYSALMTPRRRLRLFATVIKQPGENYAGSTPAPSTAPVAPVFTAELRSGPPIVTPPFVGPPAPPPSLPAGAPFVPDVPTFTVARAVWLESPRPGFKSDAAHGPLPMQCSVVNVSGEGTITVYFEIKTWQTPCPVGSDRLILAHRWETTHAPGESGYLSRVITGEVHFHGGVSALVAKGGVDAFRSQLMHPIPLGFQRSPPRVTLSSDGLTLHYVVVDTDPTIIFSPGDSGATVMDIQESVVRSLPVNIWNWSTQGSITPPPVRGSR